MKKIVTSIAFVGSLIFVVKNGGVFGIVALCVLWGIWGLGD
jgi:hypothetical protein